MPTWRIWNASLLKWGCSCLGHGAEGFCNEHIYRVKQLLHTSITRVKQNRNKNKHMSTYWNWNICLVYISSSFLLNNDNNNYLDMGKTRIQTHVHSMFSSLLLIIESDNKRPEVQLTTELACKLICHRKCGSHFQWKVTRNVCFRLTLNLTRLHAVIHLWFFFRMGLGMRLMLYVTSWTWTSCAIIMWLHTGQRIAV